MRVDWPDDFGVGGLTAELKPQSKEELRECLEEVIDDLRSEGAEVSDGFMSRGTPLAFYDGDALNIHFRKDEEIPNGRGIERRDVDICHEIIHLWDDVILADNLTLDEQNTQALALALHQYTIRIQQAAAERCLYQAYSDPSTRSGEVVEAEVITDEVTGTGSPLVASYFSGGDN